MNTNQEYNNENIKIKPSFIMSDLFIGVLSLIPGFNILSPILLLLRSRNYSVINKNIINENLSLADLNNSKEHIILDINELKSDYDTKENELKENHLTQKSFYEEEIKNLKNEYNKLQIEVLVEYVDENDYSNVTSEDIKNQLVMLKLNEKELIKNDDAFQVDEYFFENKKEINQVIKQIIKCFTAETNQILNNLTINNIDQSRNKMQKSFETTNNAFSSSHVKIKDSYLKLKLDELNLNYQILVKIQEEKEIKQQEREMLREEEKVRREIEREKIKIEKEEKQFKNEVSKLMGYLNKSSNDVEKQIYIDKIKELEEKLELLEKDKKDVLNREQNTRAGYVYIISNIGSFGKNIYKIGMTRRLEPMDRIRELSSASVPFEFDVHAMIFSEDAPKLENILHEHFRSNAINKINYRKEFYNIDLAEAKNVVYENFNNTVDFVMEPKAEEYNRSLRIKEGA